MWERDQFPIILYAAGLMGKSIKEFLEKNGVQVECFIDKNQAISNTIQAGIPVYLPEEVPVKERSKSVVLISFVKRPFEEISNYLKKLGYKKIMFAGDFCREIVSDVEIANIWWSGDFSMEEQELLLKNYDSFYDDESRIEYECALTWFHQHQECEDSVFWVNKDERYFIPEVIRKLKKGGTYVDSAFLGGEYVERINIITENKFQKIYAFPLYPEKKSYDLDERITVYDSELSDKTGQFQVRRVGLMQPYANVSEQNIHMVRLDDLEDIRHIDYIRYYSMSPILPALYGSLIKLKNDRPIISVNIGHYRSDFVKVPKFIVDNLEEYELIFRSHNYYGNDSILYAIPK